MCWRGTRRGHLLNVISMKNRVSPARLAALSLAVLIAFPVSADPRLSEVFVTGSRVEQTLETAPLGAAVILGDEILRTGATDANEAVRLIAGIAGRRDLNGGREAVIDLYGYGDAAPNNVVVVVDGIRISENELASARLSAISPEMIDRIEIIRGGAAVLWGEGASGGVIYVFTKSGAVSSNASGSMVLGLESDGGRDARADVNLSNELLAFSAQARRYSTNGYRQNSRNDNDLLNMSLVFGDKRTLRTRISVFADKLDMRWPGALPVATFEISPRQSNTPDDYGRQTQQRMTLSIERQLGAALLSIDLARKRRATSSYQDWGGGYIQTVQTHSEADQISPRLSWMSDWGTALLNTVIGLDWNQWGYFRDDTTPYGSSLENGRQTSLAGYAHTDLSLASNWRFEAGFRTEHFDRSLDRVGSLLDDKPTLSAVELGLSRVLSANWSAHARVATSYRVANTDELRYLVAPLKPQEARDAEIGARYRNGSTLISGRVFQQRTTNEIAFASVIGSPYPSNINLDPVRRVGAGLEAATELTNRLKIRSTIQTVDATLNDGVYIGNSLPLAINGSALARATYAVTAASTLDLTFRTVGAASFGNDWTNQCARKIPSANFWDVGYRVQAGGDAGWAFFLGVDNLLDKNTYSAGYTNNSCSAYNVYPDPGRRMKVNASYRFR
jgi:iron complex outermembrane receptor protein